MINTSKNVEFEHSAPINKQIFLILVWSMWVDKATPTWIFLTQYGLAYGRKLYYSFIEKI